MVLRREKDFAQIDQLHAIHLQGFDRGASGRGKTDDVFCIVGPCEMIPPSLLSRVEKRDDLARDRVNRTHLREFMPITALTGLRQILGDRQPAKDESDDVFD